MKINHEITLDVARHGVQATIPLTQHEAGVHRLIFDLYNGSVPIVFGDRDRAVLYVDGDIYDSCIVYTENGVYPNCIVCDLSAIVTHDVGEKGAVLQIYKDSDSIAYSPEICFVIREDKTNGSKVLNSPQYSAVVKAQLAAEQYALLAEQYAEAAGDASPHIRINSITGNWEISRDGGETWIDTGMKSTGVHIGSDEPTEPGVDVWINPLSDEESEIPASEIVIKQTTGDREDAVMSQAAVTKAIDITRSGYIFVDDIEGIVKYSTLEEAQANVGISKNAELLNKILEETEKASLKFGVGFYPFEEEVAIKPNLTITSDCKSATLVFPNGRGLVCADRGYFHYIDIGNINIIAKSNCIDFTGNGVNYPNNVYFSKFHDMFLESKNGNCIYAGDKYGVGGDHLVFSTSFERLHVNAPNGAGIYGICSTSLGIYYTEISDYGKCINVFQNCVGTWFNCNTSFAGAERFLYIDKNAPQNYSGEIIMRNINIEGVTKGAIYVDRNNDFSHRSIILENVSVYIVPESNALIDVHPLTFGNDAFTIEVKNLNISFANGRTWENTYSMSKSDLSIYATLDNARVIGDDVSITTRMANCVVNPNKTKYETSARSPEQYLEKYKYIPEMHIGYMHGTRGRIPYVIDVTKEGVTSFEYINLNDLYDGIVFKNSSQQTSFWGARLMNKNRNNDGKVFYISNETDYPLQIITGYGGSKLHLNSTPSHDYMHVIPSKTIYVFMTFVVGDVSHFVEIKNFTLE